MAKESPKKIWVALFILSERRLYDCAHDWNSRKNRNIARYIERRRKKESDETHFQMGEAWTLTERARILQQQFNGGLEGKRCWGIFSYFFFFCIFIPFMFWAFNSAVVPLTVAQIFPFHFSFAHSLCKSYTSVHRLLFIRLFSCLAFWAIRNNILNAFPFPLFAQRETLGWRSTIHSFRQSNCQTR